MDKGAKLLVFIFILISTPLWASCSSPSDDPFEVEEVETYYEEILPSDAPITTNVFYETYTLNGPVGQSGACYGDYLFIATANLKDIKMYNLRNKSLVYALDTTGFADFLKDSPSVYHCNQACFGPDFYQEGDPFPLLYISQRNNVEGRCFYQVFRIVLPDLEGEEYESFSLELVQTIYLPVMTIRNSLGNANLVIDGEKRLMYTYSRNNKSTDFNYGQCKISVFTLPSFYESKVVYEAMDILDSYYLGCSAVNMQGGVIHDNKLYIGQGYKSCGYINLRIVDLENKKLEKTVDLLNAGFTQEPEGLYVYDNRLMMSVNGSNIYEFLSVDSLAVW